LAAAVLGACVATFFTFLPSFLFILAGGPLVERTRDDVKLTAPLTAVTAAVVGVIVNLAVFFALHVFWPGSSPQALFRGPLDLASVAIAVIATVALVSKRVDVIPVIAASGLAGLALWALGIQGAV
jgi:chromate transporter